MQIFVITEALFQCCVEAPRMDFLGLLVHAARIGLIFYSDV